MISWTAWLTIFARQLSFLRGLGFWLYLVAVFAPHTSAMICTVFQQGNGGLRAYYSLVFRRLPFVWALSAISIPLALYLVPDVIVATLHLPHDPFFHYPPRALATLVLGQSAVVMGEEPGWRGYALPRLVERLGANAGTLALGAAWALWHLPLFAISGTAQYGTPFLPFAITLMAWSLIVTVVVLNSNGSVIGAMLFHASANVCDFTMWKPGGSLFGLAPWIVAAAAAGWWMRARREPWISARLGADATK